ncbi:ead/Ea22-like family protein [Salmonella enterica]|nr:ead/Ea22-like family protein [Salmonella enterica]EGL8404281.1 ead/Ea22-like family protein [Salmonella enterica]EGL8486752.1 ead/Ea22-like family protein [Salmonella enterica]EGL8496415.1 ead/Ea22-like family protein [Salmonella enterica]
MTNGNRNGSESEIKSEIDKRALRHAAHAAESVNSGNWSYEEFSELGLPGGAHIKIDGRDAIYCLNKPTGGIKQSRAVLAYIAAFNPKVALALLDELETAENYIAELEARAVNLPKRSVGEVMHLSEAIDVLESAIFGEHEEPGNSAMLSPLSQQEQR